jgi:cytoskeletal protein CcmA (bactofilin family)
MKLRKSNQSTSAYSPDLSANNSDNMVMVKGLLALDGDLQIKDGFTGMLKLNGCLTVARDARITGDLIVNEIIVYGSIVGSIIATKKAIFHLGSAFSGSVTAGELEFREGSQISGKRRISNVNAELKSQPVPEVKNQISLREIPTGKINIPAFSH